ncbi:MAG: histidine phosphatase family protein [Pseudomonadales bacterium]
MWLWLIRHAKSSWADAGQRDLERPLNDRGERDGPRMQAWLASEPHGAAWIWSSDAVRAQATAAFVHQAFNGATLTVDHRLYGASPEAILDVVRGTPEGVESIAVIAHNPGMSHCLNLVCGQNVTYSLPTFGVARLFWPGAVTDLSVGNATLEVLMSPKTLPDRS